MAATQSQTLAELVERHQLLTPSQLEQLRTILDCNPQPDVRTVIRDLTDRGWLTPYQVSLITRGKARELVLGPYRLLEPLGEGGMGQVFKARHAVMERVVALKVIRADRLANPDAVRRFQREIKAVARLAHPNVVTAHDAAQEGDTHYLVMEYIQGDDLNKLVAKRGRLATAEACEYVRQAALGLEHARQNGLVHRDVKPANLMLTRVPGSNAPLIKVLDLGLAQLRDATPSSDRLTGAGSVMGTPDYMAPEQAADSAAVDTRADVYALGCTLYHLLTGRPPFAGGSVPQILISHQQAVPPDLASLCPGVPPGVLAVVNRMLAKRPAERQQTPAEVAAALAPFCEGFASTVASVVPFAIAPTLAHAQATGPHEAAVPTAVPLSLATMPVSAAPSSRRTLVWLIAGAVLVLAGGTMVGCFVLWGVRSTTPADTRVTIRLEGIPADLGQGVLFFLDDKPIKLEELAELQVPPGDHHLVLKRDGKTLLVQTITAAKEQPEQRVRLQVQPQIEGDGPLRRLSPGLGMRTLFAGFVKDGKRFVTVVAPLPDRPQTGCLLHFWDTGSDVPARTMAFAQPAYTAAVSLNGESLMLWSDVRRDDKLPNPFNLKHWGLLYELRKGKEIKWDETEGGSASVMPVQNVGLSADGRFASANAMPGKAWEEQIWDLESKPGPGRRDLRNLRMRLASMGTWTTRVSWSLDYGAAAWVIADARGGLVGYGCLGLNGGPFHQQRTNAPQAAAVSGDGHFVAGSFRSPGGIMVEDFTDIRMPRELMALKTEECAHALAFSSDNLRLAAVFPRKLCVFEVATGKEVALVPLPGDPPLLLEKPMYSPAGGHLLTLADDGAAYLWTLPK